MTQGYTDKPSGSRPFCTECGEHRWSHDGYCLSARCKPLSVWLDEIAAKKSAKKTRTKREPLVDPTTGKKRATPRGKSRREAEAWYRSMGKDIPWEER